MGQSWTQMIPIKTFWDMFFPPPRGAGWGKTASPFAQWRRLPGLSLSKATGGGGLLPGELQSRVNLMQ